MPSSHRKPLVKTLRTREELLKARTEELRLANERLLRSQREYQELVNTVDGIVWEANVGEAGFTFVSRQAERILGFPIERWLTVERFWQGILHPEDRERLTGDEYIHPDRKRDTQLEYRILTAEGRTVWMRDHVKVIYEGGVPSKMRGIMVDITEAKEAEARMRTAEQEALAAARVKSDFLANMSHEIRTPLNAIIGMANLGLDTDMTEEQQESLTTIKRAADSLLSLINDILDFSKIEAGRVELELADFKLSSLCRNAMDLASPLARQKGVRLGVEQGPGLLEDYRGDAGRLLQVLLNLLSNAVKFTDPGGEIKVRISGAPAGGTRFEVTDTGVGITDEAKRRLFSPFTQADASTARRFGGTGLGLSICKRLVELMGGRIGLESEPGKGAMFWFEVMLPPAEAAVVEAPQEQVLLEPAEAKLRRILVADDNPANQKVILRLLEKLGYTAEAVGNGQEAVVAFGTGRFDLLLMDCQMPEMDGYEATQRIRELERAAGAAATPIVALTAHALSGDREKCVQAGMDDYLTKPISPRHLDQALARWLSRTRPAAPLAASVAKIGDLTVPLDLNHVHSLEKLQIEGQPDLVIELVQYFEESGPGRIRGVQEAVKGRDFEAARKAAHAFKSTCHNVGCFRLAAVCQEIESAVTGGRADSLADGVLIQRLQEEHAFAAAALRKLRDSRLRRR